MQYPDDLTVEDWRTGADHRSRAIGRDELPDLYTAPLRGSETLVFTWNDLCDPVVIAVVGADWSVATVLLESEWYSAVRQDGIGSDVDHEVILIGDQESTWRTSELLPRSAALEILQSLPDLHRARREHRWLSQWRHHPEDQAPDINL